MFCPRCKKNFEDGKFCQNCGCELQEGKIEESLIPLKSNEEVRIESEKSLENTEAKDNKEFNENEPNIKTQKKKNKLIIKILPILIILAVYLTFCGRVSDADYIGCAKTIISEHLNSPSTAKWSNEKILERDDYGRVLVTLTVDSQNGFGAYVRDNVAVVIISYDKKTGEFFYNEGAIQSWKDSEKDLSEMAINFSKTISNWNEPIEN